MTYLKTLPLLEGADVIIVDEGLNAEHARSLIAGWLQMWKDNDCNRSFELLSFSNPKSWYLSESNVFSASNVNIHDCYTVDVNAIHRKDFNVLENILKTKNLTSTVIIDCLSSLILYVGLQKALWFLENLRNQTSQLICVYRRDFGQCKVPRVERLGTTYVKLKTSTGARSNDNTNYKVEIVHQKLGGTILRQSELVNQCNATYEIRSIKIETQNNRNTDFVYESQKQKIESSFRIEMNASEMEQRKNTQLPYTLNVTNESKILYQPEDVDDIDEDDPDDDLCI